jgi:hypothetical protein
MPEIDPRIFFFCKSLHSVNRVRIYDQTQAIYFAQTDRRASHPCVAARLLLRDFFQVAFPVLPTPGAFTERVPYAFCLAFSLRASDSEQNSISHEARRLLMLLGRSDITQRTQERRLMRRFDMRLPAVVKIPELSSSEFATETQNVSARGVFFYLDKPLAEGMRIEVTMTFPPHLTLTDSVRVRFVARVVRTEKLPVSRVGVAALIEMYEFLRAAPAVSSAASM